MDELKPCPSCESVRVESCPDDHGDRTVCCQVCGMCGPTFGMSGQTLAEMLAGEDAARLKAEAAWNALPRKNEPGPATQHVIDRLKAACEGRGDNVKVVMHPIGPGVGFLSAGEVRAFIREQEAQP